MNGLGCSYNLVSKYNKTGFQPVSSPVEQVHYFGGWVEGAKPLWCHIEQYLIKHLLSYGFWRFHFYNQTVRTSEGGFSTFCNWSTKWKANFSDKMFSFCSLSMQMIFGTFSQIMSVFISDFLLLFHRTRVCVCVCVCECVCVCVWEREREG